MAGGGWEAAWQEGRKNVAEMRYNPAGKRAQNGPQAGREPAVLSRDPPAAALQAGCEDNAAVRREGIATRST